MTSPTPGSEVSPPMARSRDTGWSRTRWGAWIGLVFALQLGFIFALGDRRPITPRSASAAPALRLAAGSDELLALSDPTLFALPHRLGFARAAWLRAPAVTFPQFRWTEPPLLLERPLHELGATFAQFLQTNTVAAFELETKPAPELTPPPEPDLQPAVSARSTLRLDGDIAHRRLLNPPDLPPRPATDVLRDSVVQVLVDAEGTVLSAKLLSPNPLQPGSGSPQADQQALAFARATRFEPLPGAGSKAGVGTLIFSWHTVPLTNAPSTTP